MEYRIYSLRLIFCVLSLFACCPKMARSASCISAELRVLCLASARNISSLRCTVQYAKRKMLMNRLHSAPRAMESWPDPTSLFAAPATSKSVNGDFFLIDLHVAHRPLVLQSPTVSPPRSELIPPTAIPLDVEQQRVKDAGRLSQALLQLAQSEKSRRALQDELAVCHIRCFSPHRLIRNHRRYGWNSKQRNRNWQMR